MENGTTKDVTASLEENYRGRTPRSQELFERARKTMPGGAKGAYFHQPYPLTMARGEGCLSVRCRRAAICRFRQPSHSTGARSTTTLRS